MATPLEKELFEEIEIKTTAKKADPSLDAKKADTQWLVFLGVHNIQGKAPENNKWKLGAKQVSRKGPANHLTLKSLATCITRYYD